jgi:excisionase family DNA binding protein
MPTQSAGGEPPPPGGAFPDILTPEQAAPYLEVPVGFVLAQARAGTMPGVQLERKPRFSRRRLLRWVEQDPAAEEYVDLALQAMAEERTAEAGDWDGIPWEEAKRELGL